MNLFGKKRVVVQNVEGNNNVLCSSGSITVNGKKHTNTSTDTVIVNGKRYVGTNISIIGNSVYVDGKPAEEITEKDSAGNIIINIEGNVSEISKASVVTVSGDVDKISDIASVEVQGSANKVKDVTDLTVHGDVQEISDTTDVVVKGKVLGDIYDCTCVSK